MIKEAERLRQNEDAMIYILSIVAELIRENPMQVFPYSTRFIQSLLVVDLPVHDSLQQRNDVLAILGVIYENMSRLRKVTETKSLS